MDRYIHREGTLLLEGCRLRYMPDFSEVRKQALLLSKNHIHTIYPEHFPANVEIADFGTNSIHSDGLPFEWPHTLKEIYLDSNYIQDTDGVRWPEGLKKLSLSRNPLCTKPEMLPNDLEVLFLDRTELNELEELPRGLRFLDVTKCLLKRLQTQLPMFLEVCMAAENFLSFRGLPTYWGTCLKTLVLDRNRLQSFPSGLPDSLETLSLNYNQLTEVPQNLPKNLKHLHIIGNRLRKISLQHRQTPIETVFLNDNQLLTFVEDEQIDTGVRWANIIWEIDNWATFDHTESARRIQKAWRVHNIPKALRTWLKTARIKEELFEVSMHPTRAGKFEDLSSAWYKMI